MCSLLARVHRRKCIALINFFFISNRQYQQKIPNHLGFEFDSFRDSVKDIPNRDAHSEIQIVLGLLNYCVLEKVNFVEYYGYHSVLIFLTVGPLYKKALLPEVGTISLIVNSLITKLTLSLTSYFVKFCFKINGIN